jgi:hypothetical protein
MPHQYNTRFQAKKAAEARKAAESNFIFIREPLSVSVTVFPNHDVNTVINTYSSEKDAEIKVIQPMLKAVNQQQCRFHRIMIALRLFHYLEHHHYVLRTYQRFRDIALRKVEEFIEVAKEDQRYLDMAPITNREQYKVLCRNTVASELLMESCIRVRAIIQSF